MKKLFLVIFIPIIFIGNIIAQFCTGTSESIKFLEEKDYSFSNTIPFVEQIANCGDKTYEVCVCLDGFDTLNYQTVEIEIKQLSSIPSFFITNPMDFTLNTTTGKLEKILSFPMGISCQSLKFAGTSTNPDPVTMLIASVAGIRDTIVIVGPRNVYTLNNTSISAATTLSAQNPLPLPPNSPLPKNVRIDGTLIVDQDYTFGESSTILMGENAQIIVKQGVTLTIGNNILNTAKLKTRVLSCDKMWESIKVEGNGSLIIVDVIVQDGRTAITVEENAFLGAGNVTFQDNIIGVHQKSGNITSNISDCSFIVFNGLKEPSANALIGIKAESSTFVNVFKSNFKNITKGIEGRLSNISSYASNYEKLEFGIDNQGANNSFTGSVNSQKDNYSNIENTAINSIFGYATKVELSNINDTEYGIVTTGLPMYPSQNTFKNNIIRKANRQAITATYNFSAIENNEFINNKYDILTNNTIHPYVGTRISNNYSNSSHLLRGGILCYDGKHKVESNVIEFFGDSHVTDAMTFVGVKSGEVKGNTVDIMGDDARGVTIAGSMDVDFGCNQISGSAPLGISPAAYDLIVEQTGGKSAFFGNTLLSGQVGAAFNGASISRIGGNLMESNNLALHVQENGVVGEQYHMGNAFIPEASSVALCDNNVAQSKFIVSARHTNNSCIKVSKRIPNDYTIDWFRDECEKPGTSTYDPSSNCFGFTVPPITITKFTEDILDESTSISGYYGNPLTYTTKKQFYKVLKEDSQLRNSSSIANTFVLNNQNNAIGRLYEVQRRLMNLENTPQKSVLEEIRIHLDEKYEELNERYSLLAVAETDEDKVLLRQQQQSIIVQIIALENDIAAISTQDIEAKHNSLLGIKVLNESIELENEIVTNEVTVNNFIIEAMLEGETSFSDEQLEAIQEIALKCPFKDGNAVYTARAIYATKYPETKYNTEELCAIASTRSKRSDNNTSLKVFPNPSVDILTSIFNVDVDTKNISIDLVDNLGRVIKNQVGDNANSTNIWDISTVPNGVYTLLLKVEGKVLQQQKVVVAK